MRSDQDQQRNRILKSLPMLLLLVILMFWSLVLIRSLGDFRASSEGAQHSAFAVSTLVSLLAWAITLIAISRRIRRRFGHRKPPK